MAFTKGSFLRHLLPTPKNYDLVILASAKKEVLEQYKTVAPSLSSKTKVVFIDGGDKAEIGGDFSRLNCMSLFEEVRSLRNFDHIFKREMLLDQTYDRNVSPLPFGFNFDWLKKLKKGEEKKYEVAFWGVGSHPVRADALELISELWDCRQNGTGVHPSIKEYKRNGSFYLQELAACKIALNFRGSGWDTLRYWEIPAVGTLLVSPEPGIRIPNNFNDKEEAIYCSGDLSDLVDLCNYYLKHPEKRERIAQNGHQKMLDFHQDIHRAKEVLRVV